MTTLSVRKAGLTRRARAVALAVLCGWVLAPLQAQEQKSVRIGVIRAAPVPVLDTNQKGFEAALAGAGFTKGVNVSYDIQTTGGDAQRTQAILQKFIDDKVALIHSIGTGPTLAAMKATSSVPVVFSAVTDPVGAGIVHAGTPGKPSGTNVTGVSDRWPIGLQLETYTRMVPKAKVWGTLYNPAEVNSVQQARQLREAASKLGLQLIEAPVSSTADVRPTAFALAGRVQALFVLTDSTAAADVMAIQEASDKYQIPNFTGVSSSVQRGALAAFGIDYFLAGYAAGKKAALVLRGVNPAQVPWSQAENFGLVINQKKARALGITIPAESLRIADKVLE